MTEDSGATVHVDATSVAGTRSDNGTDGTEGTSEAATQTGTTSTSTDTSPGTGTSTSTGASTETSTDTGTSTTGQDGSSGSAGDTGLVAACVDFELGGVIGTTNADTTGLADDADPPCAAGLGGHDAGHRFVAPVDGFYAFDTAGSTFDTVVYGYSPSCLDASLGCNDDASLGDISSRLSVFLAEDHEALVVVDGWDASQAGAYSLDIDAILEPCVDADLGTGATATVGSTTGELDKLRPPCAAGLGPELIVRWTAPDDGAWVVSSAGSAFDTVLYIYEGECAGVPVACNDDVSVIDLSSSVVVTPGQGNVVTIVVDGFSAADHGDYALSLSPL
jgi:hypothetical protein